MIPKEKILDIVYKSGLRDLLMDYTVKSYKYESLTCNLGYGCKITFEINVSPEQDDNKQLQTN